MSWKCAVDYAWTWSGSEHNPYSEPYLCVAHPPCSLFRLLVCQHFPLQYWWSDLMLSPSAWWSLAYHCLTCNWWNTCLCSGLYPHSGKSYLKLQLSSGVLFMGIWPEYVTFFFCLSLECSAALYAARPLLHWYIKLHLTLNLVPALIYQIRCRNIKVLKCAR